ncbi:MAG: hypothetical protein EVJ48_04475 [Candidatus Acidulodesulfobacterium acidiphilum]|uniref:DNA 3'-5' helicase n=1 Tax=Candidatus Acidulodesulfobacterium acidiphilum TaxID=2597224 RepID=A0A520XEH0_9DELT|nr:MAG: hypothetical protein EVJ48_04475 [Candidatus Acidulodesulfobacterium acidiphilum]
MINLYLKNFNFNISNSIGILLSSDNECSHFIKKIEDLNVKCKFFTFEDLKKNFNIDGAIESPLSFPFKNIKNVLSAQAVFLSAITLNSLSDAVLLNAVCDFALNNDIILGITTETTFNGANDLTSLYDNMLIEKNYYENLIIDIYKSRLKMLLKTRILASSKHGGYTESIDLFINKMKTIRFNPKINNTNLFFLNSEKFAVSINITPPHKNIQATGQAAESISQNEINLNTNLLDMHFYQKELFDKIKIFLNTAKNFKEKTVLKRIGGATEKRTQNLELSKIQKISIKETNTALLIIAGAGAGKTKVIVDKFLYLLNFFSADSILVLTFTNNAVTEIKNRIAKKLNINEYGAFINNRILNISTYHSFFYSIIKEFYSELGYQSAPSVSDGKIGESSSNNKCTNELSITYDEIILNIVKLFQNDSIVSEISSRFKYILVDEYQDLDFLSDYLIKKIDACKGKVMYAGDDDQSIYGFNGGDLFNILSFDLFFPSGKVFVFQNNYRSNRTIVEFCNSILNNIKFRYPKKIIATKNMIYDGAVDIIDFKNKSEEEKFIEKKAANYFKSGKKTAVLVRTKKEKSKFLAIPNLTDFCSVSTIHAGKGLEYDVVFISILKKAYLKKDNRPSDFKIHPFLNFFKTAHTFKLTDIFIDDEVRLFYVAASRAKEKLYITYSGEISDFLKR